MIDTPSSQGLPAIVAFDARQTVIAEHQSPWAPGVRCVVTITIDYDGPSNDVGRGWRPLGSRSGGRYSARRGVPRYLDMLERTGIPATFFVPGYDAECHPQSVRDILRAGHEIGAHGYKHEGMLLAPDEETRRLRLTHAILADLMGRPPRGWRSPGGQKTANTLHVLRELGYQYDASDKDADLPYLLALPDGSSLIEIPNNTLSLDDYPWYADSCTPPSEVLAQWRDEFQACHAEQGFFMLVVHPRAAWGSGLPSRAAIVEQLIHDIQAQPGVQFMQVGELADWVAAHPDRFDRIAPMGADAPVL